MVLYAPPNVINLPRQQRRPSLGELFGQGFGQGLGQGIGQGYQDVQGKIKQQLEQAALQNALELIKPNASPLDNYMALLQAPASVRDLLLKSYPEYAKLQQTQDTNSALGEINSQLLKENSDPSQNYSPSSSYESQNQEMQTLQLQNQGLQNPQLQNAGMQNSVQATNQYNTENQDINDRIKKNPELEMKLFKALPLNAQWKYLEHKQKEKEYNLKLKKFQQQENIENRRLDERRFEKRKESEEAISRPYLQSIDKLRETIQPKRNAEKLLKKSVVNGNLGAFSLNNLAEYLNIEGLRSPDAAVFKFAVKENFLANLAKVGRPNQWVEQQILGMSPQIGRSRLANLAVISAMSADNDIAERKAAIAHELAQKYLKEDGIVPSNIGAEVEEKLKDYANLRYDQSAYEVQLLREKENPSLLHSLTKVEEGTPLTISKRNVLLKKVGGNKQKAANLAKQLGYTFYDRNVYKDLEGLE